MIFYICISVFLIFLLSFLSNLNHYLMSVLQFFSLNRYLICVFYNSFFINTKKKCVYIYIYICKFLIFSGMTNLIFGIGIGLFLILILWGLALLVFIISLRIEKKIGTVAIIIVSICTIVLITLPRAPEKSNTIDKKVNNYFILKL